MLFLAEEPRLSEHHADQERIQSDQDDLEHRYALGTPDRQESASDEDVGSRHEGNGGRRFGRKLEQYLRETDHHKRDQREGGERDRQHQRNLEPNLADHVRPAGCVFPHHFLMSQAWSSRSKSSHVIS